jgi:hypothetical protein
MGDGVDTAAAGHAFYGQFHDLCSCSVGDLTLRQYDPCHSGKVKNASASVTRILIWLAESGLPYNDGKVYHVVNR